METLLIKIGNFLIMNLHSDMGVGLLRGKMGLAVFLYHYSRYAKNKVCEDAADRLIDDILANVNPRLSLDIFDGVSGVSLGLKHLTKHGYIESEGQDMNLFDIEKKIFDLNFKWVDEKNINLSLSKFYIMSLAVTENNKKFDPVIIDSLRTYNSSFSKEKLSEIPPPIISSVLFFISSIEKTGLYFEDMRQLKFKILTSLTERVDYDREARGDLLVLTQIIRQINSRRGRDIFNQIILPYDNLNVDTSLSFNDFIENYLWQSLLYDLPLNDSLSLNFEFEREVNNMLSVSNITLPVFQGITGIGLFILKNKLLLQ